MINSRLFRNIGETFECHLANLGGIAYCNWAAGMETGATQGATRNTANRTLPGKGG